MTDQEAIKILGQYDVSDLHFYTTDGEEIPFTEWSDAIEMAISALDKQIPRKAIGEHYARMRCPSCNHRIPSGGGSSSRRRDNWCNYCGQAMDFSEWGDE